MRETADDVPAKYHRATNPKSLRYGPDLPASGEEKTSHFPTGALAGRFQPGRRKGRHHGIPGPKAIARLQHRANLRDLSPAVACLWRDEEPRLGEAVERCTTSAGAPVSAR